MTPQALFPILEGIAGRLANADQNVSDWVRMVKLQMSGANYRYNTDYGITLLEDVDETGEPQADATDLLAALVIMKGTIATDAAGWVVFVDADSNTFDGTAALPNTVVAAIQVKDVANTGVNEYYPMIFFSGATQVSTAAKGLTGIRLNTGLTVSCDGVNGGNPATNALDVLIIYRT
jgi:L-fucose isomerase-like protein